jgi:hypothetical protein
MSFVPAAQETVAFLHRHAWKLVAVSTTVFLATLISVRPSARTIVVAVAWGIVMFGSNYLSWNATTNLRRILLWSVAVAVVAAYLLLGRLVGGELAHVSAALQFAALVGATYAVLLILLRRRLSR